MKEKKCYADYMDNELMDELFKMHNGQRGEAVPEDEPTAKEERHENSRYTICNLIDELYEEKNRSIEEFNDRFLKAPKDEPEETEEESSLGYLYNAIETLISEIEEIGENDVSNFKGMASVMIDFGLKLSFSREMMNTFILEVYEANGIEE